MNELLKRGGSNGERQRLKYAIVKTAGMSNSQEKSVYGFNNMASNMNEVESALEDAAAIRDAIQNIAEVKDQSVLRSLGICNTRIENESSESDDSETDSDIPEDDGLDTNLDKTRLW